MCSGRSGMITFSIASEMISLNSSRMRFRLPPLILALPRPSRNARNRAVITDISGGMVSWKYDVRLLPSAMPFVA